MIDSKSADVLEKRLCLSDIGTLVHEAEMQVRDMCDANAFHQAALRPSGVCGSESISNTLDDGASLPVQMYDIIMTAVLSECYRNVMPVSGECVSGLVSGTTAFGVEGGSGERKGNTLRSISQGWHGRAKGRIRVWAHEVENGRLTF